MWVANVAVRSCRDTFSIFAGHEGVSIIAGVADRFIVHVDRANLAIGNVALLILEARFGAGVKFVLIETAETSALVIAQRASIGFASDTCILTEVAEISIFALDAFNLFAEQFVKLAVFNLVTDVHRTSACRRIEI